MVHEQIPRIDQLSPNGLSAREKTEHARIMRVNIHAKRVVTRVVLLVGVVLVFALFFLGFRLGKPILVLAGAVEAFVVPIIVIGRSRVLFIYEIVQKISVGPNSVTPSREANVKDQV